MYYKTTITYLVRCTIKYILYTVLSKYISWVPDRLNNTKYEQIIWMIHKIRLQLVILCCHSRIEANNPTISFPSRAFSEVNTRDLVLYDFKWNIMDEI
jgi:hypothetical protein